MIGIIDYGRGNLRSVEKALEKSGFKAKVLAVPEQMEDVRGVILPGVGAFADAMAALDEGGWLEPMQKHVRAGKPFLGICLGMQLLFETGEEHGQHRGLGFLKGKVVKFPPGLKIPHMGWNTLDIISPGVLLQDIPQGACFYFVHSYLVLPEEKDCIAATCDYGLDFPAVAGRDNIWGAQFHPEKSGPWGLAILNNFGNWVNNE